MWHYIKYLLKLMFGFMVIIALDVMLKKADTSLENGDWWFYMTLILYSGYCYLEYKLEDKEKD